MNKSPPSLLLETGEAVNGQFIIPPKKPLFGEVVFTTGMTGYLESLTDPSYAGQFLVFTYPLIGNYGVCDSEGWESSKIHARAVIVGHACTNWHHSSAVKGLVEWLQKEQVPLLAGVDTRALTKMLRTHGTLIGSLAPESSDLSYFPHPHKEHLVSQVSPKAPQIYRPNEEKKIILVDCGMKENILRHLLSYPLTIKRVPHDYDYSQEDFDGVFVSNGPGDPTKCTKAIAHLEKAMKRKKPIFGICLGTQLLALAAGAKTYKLPFGHRGHNQPCEDCATKRCYITSQNHGYAVDDDSLGPDWAVSFRNLNDGSIEGIRHRKLPFWAVQFHPEAAPGPTDTEWLFADFFQTVQGKVPVNL